MHRRSLLRALCFAPIAMPLAVKASVPGPVTSASGAIGSLSVKSLNIVGERGPELSVLVHNRAREIVQEDARRNGSVVVTMRDRL